jgi:energy-coupling factor transport system permease protein
MIDLSKITFGQYAYRDSAIHRLDPRIKMLVTGCYLVLIVLLKRVLPLISCFFILILFFHLSGLSPFIPLRNIRSFILLLLLTFLIHACSTPGQPFLRIAGILTVTCEGIARGFLYVFRIVLLISYAHFLTLCTSPMEFTDGLERVMRPLRRLRLPSHELAMMISISLRFIPIMLEEVERIQKAQISRGARFDGNIIRRIRSLIPIVIPLMVSTFRRANDLSFAMDARCYQGSDHRSSFQELILGKNDWLALIGNGLVWIPITVWGIF